MIRVLGQSTAIAASLFLVLFTNTATAATYSCPSVAQLNKAGIYTVIDLQNKVSTAFPGFIYPAETSAVGKIVSTENISLEGTIAPDHASGTGYTCFYRTDDGDTAIWPANSMKTTFKVANPNNWVFQQYKYGAVLYCDTGPGPGCNVSSVSQ